MLKTSSCLSSDSGPRPALGNPKYPGNPKVPRNLTNPGLPVKCLWLLNIGTIELGGDWDLLMVYINWDHELGGACEMLGVNNNWNPELRGNQALIHKVSW